ncbi:hypothetical protein FOA52_014356 [Chlamydomonas sp. UWO 241]|nr:hypothetical protein FOA52_014356 [Chlamydomonas sp. UWO 241]
MHTHTHTTTHAYTHTRAAGEDTLFSSTPAGPVPCLLKWRTLAASLPQPTPSSGHWSVPALAAAVAVQERVLGALWRDFPRSARSPAFLEFLESPWAPDVIALLLAHAKQHMEPATVLSNYLSWPTHLEISDGPLGQQYSKSSRAILTELHEALLSHIVRNSAALLRSPEFKSLPCAQAREMRAAASAGLCASPARAAGASPGAASTAGTSAGRALRGGGAEWVGSSEGVNVAHGSPIAGGYDSPSRRGLVFVAGLDDDIQAGGRSRPPAPRPSPLVRGRGGGGGGRVAGARMAAAAELGQGQEQGQPDPPGGVGGGARAPAAAAPRAARAAAVAVPRQVVAARRAAAAAAAAPGGVRGGGGGGGSGGVGGARPAVGAAAGATATAAAPTRAATASAPAATGAASAGRGGGGGGGGGGGRSVATADAAARKLSHLACASSRPLVGAQGGVGVQFNVLPDGRVEVELHPSWSHHWVPQHAS